MFVVDASVAAKWFFSLEADREEAKNVLEDIIVKPAFFVVPELFFIEVSSVMLKKMEGNPSFCLNVSKLLYGLGLKSLSHLGESLERSILLASQTRLSLYDSIYLELAITTGGKWVTADKKAMSALGKLKKHAIFLRDYKKQF